MEESKSESSSGPTIVVRSAEDEDGQVELEIVGASLDGLSLDPPPGLGTDDALDLVEKVCREDEEIPGSAAVVLFGGTVIFTKEPKSSFNFSDAVLMIPVIKRKGTAGVSARGIEKHVASNGYDISTLRRDAYTKFGLPGTSDHGSFRDDLVKPDGRPIDKGNYTFTVGVTNDALDIISSLEGEENPGLSVDMIKHIAVLAENGCFRTYKHPHGKDFVLTVARRPEPESETETETNASLEAALEAFRPIGVLWNPSRTHAVEMTSPVGLGGNIETVPVSASLQLDVIMRVPIANCSIDPSVDPDK